MSGSARFATGDSPLVGILRSYNVSGVFGTSGEAQMLATGSGLAPEIVTDLTFLASRGSSLFNGTKLQPKALQSLPCIRY